MLEQARDNMLMQQLRPFGVIEQKIVDLSGQNLTLEDLDEIAALLPQSPLLTTLNLTNNNFGPLKYSSIPKFIDAVGEHANLQNIYIQQLYHRENALFKTYLNDQLRIFTSAVQDPVEPIFSKIVNSLLAIIRVANKLNSIDNCLSDNPHLKVYKNILDSLSKSDTLEFTNLTATALYFLAEAFADVRTNKNPKFKTLVLNSLSFEFDSRDIANKFLKISRFVDKLEITNMAIKKEFLAAIKITLCNKRCALKNISFKNCNISPSDTLNLLSILTEQPQCQIDINNTLIIKDNHFILNDKEPKQEFLKDMAVKLAEKTDWQIINLAAVEKEISTQELINFLNCFSKNKNGFSLHLPQNFKFDAVTELTAPITNLSIKKLPLTQKNMQSISGILQQCKTITELELTEIDFNQHYTQDQITEFAKAISQSQLKKLDLSNTKHADKLFAHISSSQLEIVILTGWQPETVYTDSSKIKLVT